MKNDWDTPWDHRYSYLFKNKVVYEHGHSSMGKNVPFVPRILEGEYIIKVNKYWKIRDEKDDKK